MVGPQSFQRNVGYPRFLPDAGFTMMLVSEGCMERALYCGHDSTRIPISRSMNEQSTKSKDLVGRDAQSFL